jgi:hypothetical protein
MSNDNDAIYVWVAQGENAETLCKTFAPGHLLVKFGVTSQRREQRRIHEVAKRYGFTAEIVCFHETKNALIVEQSLLKFGTPAAGVYGDGSTEFRFISKNLLDEAVEFVKCNAGEKIDPAPAPIRERFQRYKAAHTYPRRSFQTKRYSDARYTSARTPVKAPEQDWFTNTREYFHKVGFSCAVLVCSPALLIAWCVRKFRGRNKAAPFTIEA